MSSRAARPRGSPLAHWLHSDAARAQHGKLGVGMPRLAAQCCGARGITGLCSRRAAGGPWRPWQQQQQQLKRSFISSSTRSRSCDGGGDDDDGSRRRGPLDGLRVLDCGNFLAGPVVSMHLSAMGAEVIKVEKVGGDDSRVVGPFAQVYTHARIRAYAHRIFCFHM